MLATSSLFRGGAYNYLYLFSGTPIGLATFALCGGAFFVSTCSTSGRLRLGRLAEGDSLAAVR